MNPTEEFNLSEKIEEAFHQRRIGIITTNILLEAKINEIVKEFMRRLLDTNEGLDEDWIRKETIKELAGEKLI